MKEFKVGDPVYYFLGASTVRCEVHQVRRATVRVRTLAGQIVTKRKEELRPLQVQEV